jgi:TonB family protein
LALVTALSEVDGSWSQRAPVAPRPIAEVEFEALSETDSDSQREQPTTMPPRLLAGGPPLHGALDRSEAEGRGGELSALDRAALLFPFVSPLTLQDTELNNLAVSQVQRIRTAEQRATLEERRATPRAEDEVLLASGKRGHAERRDPTRLDAVLGAAVAARASMPSEPQKGRMAEAASEPDSPRFARREARLKPARGILRGSGQIEMRAAKVTFARPNVDRAAAATPAEQLEERVRDDADSELLAAKLQRSFVDTSVQQAREVGAGSGGAALNPNALGEVGRGSGAKARPYTPGTGNFNALDTSDTRYLRWFMQQRARVQRELVFPRERAIAKDQGTSLYSVVLARDGALSGRPRLVRSSGFADFDRAAALAIERALPFMPLPAELAPELDSIALLIPVAFSNPMVE